MLNSGLQHMLRNLSILILTTFTLIGCSDECREYSDFSCDDIEKASYNVYFYYPSQSEEYLGVAQGLSQCGNIANDFAYSKELNRNPSWSYICCMKANGSECYEKHR